MRILLLNIIFLASSATVVYGLWLYSHSLALIVGGLATMAASFVAGVSIGQSRTRNL